MRAALLLPMVLTGCAGFIPGPWDNPEVEPTFRIIYSKFLEEATRFGRGDDLYLRGLRIRMADPAEMPEGAWGTCGARVIKINSSYWGNLPQDSSGNYARELLVFHEMGHCTLGQDHRVNSVMDPRLGSTYYAWKREDYLQEFFSHRSLVPGENSYACYFDHGEDGQWEDDHRDESGGWPERHGLPSPAFEIR